MQFILDHPRELVLALIIWSPFLLGAIAFIAMMNEDFRRWQKRDNDRAR